MTALNYPQLIASFPDNNSGLVYPENIRDLVDSVQRVYSGRIVVKSGNIEGNKFPDPEIDGFIHLVGGTTYEIDGSVSVLNPLTVDEHLGEKSVLIRGASGYPFVDKLSLDASIAGSYLFDFSASAINASIFISGVAYGALNAGSSCWNVPLAGVGIIDADCVHFGNGGIINASAFLSFSRGAFYGWNSPIILSGVNKNIQFINVGTSSGFPFNTLESIVDATAATINELQMASCQNRLANSAWAFVKVLDDSTILSGAVVGCTREPGANGHLILGIDETSVNTTFSGNIDNPNTNVGGALLMQGNIITTVLAGSNLWSVMRGSGAVLADGACRVQAYGETGFQYIGKEAIRMFAVITGSAFKVSGGGSDHYEIGLFKNGVLVSGAVPAIVPKFLSTAVSDFSIAVPVELSTNDYLQPVVRDKAGAVVDVVFENIQFILE